MARVRSRDTSPEIFLRKLLTQLGFRYRLHRKDLPGTPDFAFISRRKAIFIHGCFWHGHTCRRGARLPKTNRDYWTAKIAGNRTRDVRVRDELTTMGWSVLTIHECELKPEDDLRKRLIAFLA